ncbi:AraC family transcriptional regulator [Alkalihalobacillus sp. TS-13]|uniref:AraC family transcriptional regulator n=1 Tax=Alkalihalobacillus sp. TS-13 TaxID=2842455 RepID=UPI002892BE3E|nr:AraC family transcriptional regulator [Alkalihalobacillus sp. TS-13]
MRQPLHQFIAKHPIVPFIREADYAVRKPWSMLERRLLDYLLVYIQEGKCVFNVEGKDYFLSEGNFCLVQPNELVTLKGTTKTITPFAHLDFFYNQHREQSFPTKAGQTNISEFEPFMQPKLNDFAELQIPVHFKPEQPIQFRDSFLKMIGLWQSGDTLGLIEAQNLGSELIHSIMKQYGKYRPPGHVAPEDFNWITSYFSFRLSENITIGDMAKRARLSPSRFSTLFREHFGKSPYQYLLQLRIEHAEELLLNSPLKLHQIAEFCGFADAQHFSKAFKKMTGKTPGSYRKQL